MQCVVSIKHFLLSAKIPGIALAIALIPGCIMSNGPISQAPSSQANQMVMVGIPILLGGFGSAVPVSNEYMITAKHVARLSWDFNVIHHPYCDLALIRRKSVSIPTWGLIYPDQPVAHHGHSLLGNSIKGEGKYLQDVIDTNTDCLYSLSDAPVMSGMSGGPVFNAEGEIVGITVAIVHNPEDLRNLRPAVRYSQFVPSTLIFDWLTALDISTASASPALATIQVSQYVTDLNRPNRQIIEVAGVPDTQSGLQKTNINQLTPVDRDSSMAAASSTPFDTYRMPVSSTFLSPTKRNVADNSAEALSGIRSEPALGPQLTSQPSTSVPQPSESAPSSAE